MSSYGSNDALLGLMLQVEYAVGDIWVGAGLNESRHLWATVTSAWGMHITTSTTNKT